MSSPKCSDTFSILVSCQKLCTLFTSIYSVISGGAATLWLGKEERTSSFTRSLFCVILLENKIQGNVNAEWGSSSPSINHSAAVPPKVTLYMDANSIYNFWYYPGTSDQILVSTLSNSREFLKTSICPVRPQVAKGLLPDKFGNQVAGHTPFFFFPSPPPFLVFWLSGKLGAHQDLLSGFVVDRSWGCNRSDYSGCHYLWPVMTRFFRSPCWRVWGRKFQLTGNTGGMHGIDARYRWVQGKKILLLFAYTKIMALVHPYLSASTNDSKIHLRNSVIECCICKFPQSTATSD